MAVLITTAGGKDENFHDGEEELHSYAVTGAGVLRVLMQQPGGAWFVLFDYSPAGWVKVQGTRYLGTDLELLNGADGSTKTMAEAAKTAVP